MQKYLLIFLLFIGLNSLSAQVVVIYDCPFDSLINMHMTSGDICSGPYTIEEANQQSAGNTWGCSWTSTNAGTPTDIQLELSFTVNDTVSLYPTTLNGFANNNVDPGPPIMCDTNITIFWDLDPTHYIPMGHNVFMVNYAASTIVNQLDNLPVTHDPFIRVHVTYSVGSSGIEENPTYAPKKLIKITDVLGRETMDGPNKTLIYMYSDGSFRKGYRLE